MARTRPSRVRPAILTPDHLRAMVKRRPCTDADLQRLTAYGERPGFGDGAATVRDLCDWLEIDRATFYRWRRETPAFDRKVQELRDAVDDLVEQAVLKRALGYEITTTSTKDRDAAAPGKDERVVTTKEEHIVPDVQAAKFWLTNRRRDTWSDRKVVEHGENFADMVEAYMKARDAGTIDITPEKDDE